MTAITTQDVGAAAGTRTWTDDLQPGLHELLGENGAGKTTFLRTVLAASAAKRDFQLPRHYDLDGRAVVEARLKWGDAFEVVTREIGGGEVETVRAGKLPRVREIGRDLVTLVQPHAKGDEPRQRARAEALARLLGIGVDDAALRGHRGDPTADPPVPPTPGLFLAVEAPETFREGDARGVRMPGDDLLMRPPAAALVGLWERLLERARARSGAKDKPLVSTWGPEIRERLIRGTYKTLVDACDELRDGLLLPLRRTAERLGLIQAEDVAAAEGAVAEVSGEAIPGVRHAAFLGAAPASVVEAEEREARSEARRVAGERAAGEAAERRRAETLASLGEEPADRGPTILRLLEQDLAAKREHLESSERRHATGVEAHLSAERERLAAAGHCSTSRATWRAVVAEIDRAGPIGHGDRAIEALRGWADAAEELAAASAAERSAFDDLAGMARALERSSEEEARVRAAVDDENKIVRESEERRHRWRYQREIAERPIDPYPTAEEVAAAEEAADVAAGAVDIARDGDRYRALWAKLDTARAGARWLAQVHDAAALAATDAWTALGEVMTAKVDRPWIRMRGLVIEVATKGRGGAGQQIDRAPGARAVWREIDGGDLSTGGGAAPFLDLAVETTQTGEVVFIEWTETSQPVASLGPAAKARLSAAIEARGAYWIAEQPDGGEPRIERVEPSP